MINFTLIIPTHNRHHYLKRSMEYFKDLQAEVIYCDSSSERYKGELFSNIKYIHLPDNKFAEKILVALTNITTEFVAMCADDDFILIDSLCNGLDFMSHNKNYKTIVGKYLGFKEIFDGDFYPIYHKIPEDIELGFDKNGEVFFKNYYQIMWAMYDKNILLKAFEIINKAKFNNENFIELVIGACACYEGGIKFMKEMWGIREISIQEHWGTRHVPITSRKIAETNGDFQKFRELVDSNTFVGYSDLIINSYLNGHTKNTGYLRNIVSKMIPGVIKKLIRKYIIFQNPEPKIVFDNTSSELLSSITLLLMKESSTK
jgi:glycosyltransferase domain-containing protein